MTPITAMTRISSMSPMGDLLGDGRITARSPDALDLLDGAGDEGDAALAVDAVEEVLLLGRDVAPRLWGLDLDRQHAPLFPRQNPEDVGEAGEAEAMEARDAVMRRLEGAHAEARSVNAAKLQIEQNACHRILLAVPSHWKIRQATRRAVRSAMTTSKPSGKCSSKRTMSWR